MAERTGASITFNDILRLAGVEPKTVVLLRHADPKRVPLLYAKWRANRQDFERYQATQSKDEFEPGATLASFVAMPRPRPRYEALFVGMYKVLEVGRAPLGTTDPLSGLDVSGEFQYRIEPLDALSEYVGRLTIDWGKGLRSWKQHARRHEKPVLAITHQVDPPFPGFRDFVWDIENFEALYPSWVDVLSKVKGVYLLVDKENGRRYVGSATGEYSLWGRLREYAITGHGGNVKLRRYGRRPYQVSILQIGSVDSEILEMESVWTAKLMTREFGLN